MLIQKTYEYAIICTDAFIILIVINYSLFVREIHIISIQLVYTFFILFLFSVFGPFIGF